MTSEQQQLQIPPMQGKENVNLDGNAVEDLSAVKPISPTPSQQSPLRLSMHLNLHPDGIMIEEPLIDSPHDIGPTDRILSKSPSLTANPKKSATANGIPTASSNGRLSESLHPTRAATTTMIPQLQKQQQPSTSMDLASSPNSIANTLYKVDTYGSIRNPNRTSLDKLERKSTFGPDLGDLAPEEQLILEQEIAARRAARRASRRRLEEEDDERVLIGTMVAEGHRNYQLM
ncbi:hypothetical protein K450DRAFT_231587 [Umbelopsis ramanniana AG]|uniref:Uncharacterized protein n=1 Tax=Umbelopsis ramanniana AG TaxID=1314678 RepID=A0AAD5EDJ6_UMBRA|nr:uncharacterized protein K450DRAFT_231587 [Umbelopsis ramanniana AG]KAI8581499.1 hypothetical protein K450DRAFT_231587 [Umbelopsis ramanniana AG]